MAVTDLDGRFVDVNPAFCAMLGRDRGSVIGRSPNDFIVHYDGVVRAQIADMVGGVYGSVRGEASVRHGDGTLRWVVVSVGLVRNSAGAPDFFVVQLQDISERIAAERALTGVEQRLGRALHGVVTSVAAAVDARDPYTAGHQRSVAEISTAIAGALGLDSHTTNGIRLAATIHDIGKIAVPAEILAMPRRLTAPEFDLVKAHPVTGHDIVSSVEFPWPIARMILEHHERLDGSGYPNGRRGAEILLGSRIIAVADTLEAMSSHRPYRPALGIDAALDAIREGRGTYFDVDVVDACERCVEQWGHDLPVVRDVPD